MLILIAGSYRSGTRDDPQKMADNFYRLEEASWPLFKAGHTSIHRRVGCTSFMKIGGE